MDIINPSYGLVMGSIPVGGAILKCCHFHLKSTVLWYNTTWIYVPEKGENMALENKLGMTDSAKLVREEERISKTRAI